MVPTTVWCWRCPEYTCKYSAAGAITAVRWPSVIWGNNCLITSLTEYLQMCSVHAKKAATQSLDQGPHYHIIKSLHSNQRRPTSQRSCPSSAILVGQGGTEWERKGASPVLLQWPNPGFWSGLHQPHLLQETWLQGIGWGRTEGGPWFSTSLDLSQRQYWLNTCKVGSDPLALQHGCCYKWLDLPPELPRNVW